jgi:hypothetical protein
MNQNEVNCVSKYLSENIGMRKGLAQWCQDINKESMFRRRLTQRELACIFNRKIKNNNFTVERLSYPTQYTFYHREHIE